jgi:hypothetical protein
MIAIRIASIVSAVLLAIAAVHVYWAAGGRWGAAAAVPARPGGHAPDIPLLQPSPLSTLAVALALIVAAGLLLGRVGIIPRVAPAWVYTYGAFGLGGVFLLRAIGEFRYVGAFKRVRSTRFATLDTFVYTPLCAGLAAAVFYVAAS